MTSKKPPVQRESCGTHKGSVTHYRKGEKPCNPCRKAKSEYQARTTSAWQSYALSLMRKNHATEYRQLVDALDPRLGNKYYRAAAILRDMYIKEYLDYVAAYKAAHS